MYRGRQPKGAWTYRTTRTTPTQRQPQQQPLTDRTLTLTIPTSLMFNPNRSRNSNPTPTLRQLFRKLLTKTNNELTTRLEAMTPIQVHRDHHMEIMVVYPGLADPTQRVRVRAQVDFMVPQALSNHLLSREVLQVQRSLSDNAIRRCQSSRNRWDASQRQRQTQQMRELRERLELLELRDHYREHNVHLLDPPSQQTYQLRGTAFRQGSRGSTIGV